MGDCPSYDHGRQAQIRKQADPFCTGGNPKAFQDLSKKTALFLAEDLAVLPGEPLKDPVSYTHLTLPTTVIV